MPIGAPPVEVKAAYRQLVRQWHPDRFQQASEEARWQAEEKLKGITAAYRRISEEWSRDLQLGEEIRSEPGGRRGPGSANRSAGAENVRRETFRSARREEASRDSHPAGSSSASPPYQPRPWRLFSSLWDLSAVWWQGFKAFIATSGTRTSVIWRRHLRRPFLAVGLLVWASLAASSSLIRVSQSIFVPQSAVAPQGQASDVSRGTSDSSSPEVISDPDKTPADSLEEARAPSVNPAPEADDGADKPPGYSISKSSPAEPFPPAKTMPESVAPLHENGPYFFSLGASQSEVLHVQGLPTRVKGHTWMYGLSEVHFKEGRVVRFNNFDGSLKIRLSPSETTIQHSSPFITLGSHKNDVIRTHGTPTRVVENRWYYGFSEVRFKEEKVVGYDNFFRNLTVRMEPSESYKPATPSGFFTVGSTRDDVLAVQGTPTAVQGNLWFYELSNVQFRDGKVQWAFNSSGNLLFVPPEQGSDGP